MHASATSKPAPGDDQLVGGDVKTLPLTLVAGTYTRGQVLGTVVGGIGELDAAANATAICPFDIELTDPTDLSVYVGGDFNEAELDYGAEALGDVKISLAQRNIYIRKWGAA